LGVVLINHNFLASCSRIVLTEQNATATMGFLAMMMALSVENEAAEEAEAAAAAAGGEGADGESPPQVRRPPPNMARGQGVGGARRKGKAKGRLAYDLRYPFFCFLHLCCCNKGRAKQKEVESTTKHHGYETSRTKGVGKKNPQVKQRNFQAMGVRGGSKRR
jgi:hypothetical protein